MKTKIKYALGLMAVSLLFVPMLFTGDVGASYDTVNDCGYIVGTATGNNVGNVVFQDLVDVCIDDDGNVSSTGNGFAMSDNVGMIRFDYNPDGSAPPTVDMETGVWTGYAYAPMHSSNPNSTLGTYFDMEGDAVECPGGVVTDTITGEMSGSMYSPNLGCIDMTGMVQSLPPLEIGVTVSTAPYGYQVAGNVVANGTSSYRTTVTLDFPEELYIDNAFLVGFQFRTLSDLEPSDGSDLRLIEGQGSVNDALNQLGFYRGSYTAGDGAVVPYYMYTRSFAPTADLTCNNANEATEVCVGGSNQFALGELTLAGNLAREIEWVMNTGSITDGNTVGGVEVFELNDPLSYEPVYELDQFGLLDPESGTRITDLANVPALEKEVPYDFTGKVVRNPSSSTYILGYELDFDYSTDAAGFGFYKGACTGVGSNTVVSPSTGTTSVLATVLGLEICDEGGTDLPVEGDPDYPAQATVRSTWRVTLKDGGSSRVTEYSGQLFPFADVTVPFPDTRVWVEGTVSGTAAGDDLTIVGDVSKFELRQSIFQEVTVMTRSVSVDPGSGTVDAFFNNSGGQELVGGEVYYYTDDVTINGGDLSSGDPLTIVVVGGDVFLASDITASSGELGIVVLEDSAGNGGNIHVDNDVNNIEANMFADGSFLRANSGGVVYGEADLKGQLYIVGSLISENTIGGYEDGDTPCMLGNGEVGNCADSQEQDLEFASYYQLCNPFSIDGDGNIVLEGGDPEPCPGHTESDYSGAYAQWPVVIEYNPPSADLPVFNLAGIS